MTFKPVKSNFNTPNDSLIIRHWCAKKAFCSDEFLHYCNKCAQSGFLHPPKEVMFSGESVCLSVYLSVCLFVPHQITQKVLNGF